MEKRGTGWIPDYPDVNDYTLANEAIQNLSNKIQSHGDTASIENLANKVHEALGILAQEKQCNDPNQKKLTDLQDSLVKEILGDVRFVTVELHSVLKQEMADSEVLLIKNYLQRIISTWKQFYKCTYQPVITNTTFDSETHNAVIEVLKTQGSLQADGLVGKDDMKALELLAHGAELARDINPFFDLIKSNAERYKNCIKKNKEKINNEPYRDNLFYQGVLTLYLFPVVENLNELLNIINKHEPTKNLESSLKEAHFLDLYMQNLRVALKNITDNIKDNQQKYNIKNIVDDFKESLTKTGWPEDELRDLAFLSDLFKNKNVKKAEVNKAEAKKNDPLLSLESLIAQYETFKKEPSTSYKLLKDEICRNHRKFRSLMGQLYLACPPEIPSQLFQIESPIPIPTPIPLPADELFQRKFLARLSTKLEDTEDTIQQLFTQLRENCPSTQKLLQPFVEILVQILMPLGQYRNLSEVIDRVINKIFYVLQVEEDNQEKTRKLIRETLEEYNVTQPINSRMMGNNGFNFQDLIVEALENIDTDSQSGAREPQEVEGNSQPKEKIDQEVLLPKDSLLYSIINSISKKFKQRKHSNQKTEKLRSTKKPLFEISPSQLEFLIDIAKNPSKQSEQSSQQMNNSLVFPINSSLRKKIQTLKELHKKLHKDAGKEVVEERVFLSLPEFVDLTYWCTPVEDQGALNSCTAHAGIALSEYAENKSSGTYIDGSSRFLYKVTRNLMQREGDSGASVRDTMKAMVAFGVCPEQYWSYDEDKFDEEPTPFCYSFAENYKTLKYFRLDYASISRYTLLAQVKVLLVSEIPCIFGFTLYNSVYDEFNVQKGHIPLPHKRDKVIGGHTVVAVGYHDRKVIENGDGKRAEGALLIRNSWGTRWGQGGYGWLPYDYIVQGLTADWWSLLKAEWFATGRFGAGASAWNPDKGKELKDQIPPPPPP